MDKVTRPPKDKVQLVTLADPALRKRSWDYCLGFWTGDIALFFLQERYSSRISLEQGSPNLLKQRALQTLGGPNWTARVEMPHLKKNVVRRRRSAPSLVLVTGTVHCHRCQWEEWCPTVGISKKNGSLSLGVSRRNRASKKAGPKASQVPHPALRPQFGDDWSRAVVSKLWPFCFPLSSWVTITPTDTKNGTLFLPPNIKDKAPLTPTDAGAISNPP